MRRSRIFMTLRNQISAAAGIPQKRSTAISRKPMIRHPHSRDSVSVGFRTAVVFAFSMAYAAGYASMGAFTDRVGIRIGLVVAAIIWSVASAAHGLVASVAGFT